MNEHEYQAAVKNVRGRGSAADWYQLGCILMGQGKWGSAAGCFSRVVELSPEQFMAWADLGWCRHLAGGNERSGWEALLVARQKAPNEATPPSLMSQIELMFGDAEAAVRTARRAVALSPGSAMHRVGLALALMRGGEWVEGWREYEHRFEYKIPELRTRPYRLWRGEEVEHLYIEQEQGAGDGIFALRWVPLAAACAERVTLYVQQALYSLVDRSGGLPGNVEVLPMPRPLPVADAWCPMMSLPVALERGKPFWPGRYVLSEAVPYEGCPSNIAICWSGDPTHEQTANRDCPLAEFLRLAEIPGVRLHSVQVGGGQNQFGELGCYGLIEDREPEITNFEDTAKVLGEMDLVVCVDTAVGHLAGAMGVPCWLLVNRRGQDFRWGMEGETTGWYPGHRLFRRGLDEGWGSVLERVAVELRGLVGEVAT